MLNHIWAFLIAIGIIVGVGTAIKNANMGETVTTVVDGKTVKEFKTYPTFRKKLERISLGGKELTNAAFNSVSFRYTDPVTGKDRDGAVGIAIGFIGIMALWLGFMKVAEAAGLIQALSRLIAPIFKILFPTIPAGHPAGGAIMMNMAANMLGLDNAATPLGIKAMKELQELNGKKDTASNAMCMFLIINVSSITLIPASLIGYRVQAKSADPMIFWGPMLIATTIGTLSAIIMAKIAERFSPDTPLASEVPPEELRAQEEEAKPV